MVVSLEPKLAEGVADGLFVEVNELVLQVCDRRQCHPLGELDRLGELVARVLRVDANLAHAREPHLSTHRLELAEHELEECRLAGAVGAHEGDARVHVEPYKRGCRVTNGQNWV